MISPQEVTEDLRSLVIKAAILLSSGKSKEAIDVWQEALDQDPESAEIWTSLGNSHMALWDLESARKCFQKAAQFGKSDYLLASQFVEAVFRGDVEDAQRLAPGILGNGKHTLPFRLILADFLWKQAKKEEAVEILQGFLRLKEAPEAWNILGTYLIDVGRPQEALESFAKAAELDKDYLEAWNNQGVAQAILGHPEEAVSCFEEALSLNPEYADAHNNKAVALHSLGQHAEALHAYDDALEQDPRRPVFLENRMRTKAAHEAPSPTAAMDLPEVNSAEQEAFLLRLMMIPGMTEARSAALRRAGFASPARIQQASPQDLRAVEGITQRMADRIKKAFA